MKTPWRVVSVWSRLLVLAALSGLALSPVSATAVGPPPRKQSAVLDTLWFGGTRWDPVDLRWEAVADSVWTFETGLGSAINTNPSIKPVGFHSSMEGWTGIEFQDPSGTGKFRRLSEADFQGTGSICVGSATGVLGGDWSLWSGLTEMEALAQGWAAGQGYGNVWDIAVERSFAYAGGPVTLEYDFTCDTEPGFDYAFVLVDKTGTTSPDVVRSYTGRSSGHAIVTLTSGVELPNGPGTIRILFALASDGAYSDQDGNYPTECGGFAVDNVRMTGGVVYGPQDFEQGNDGWIVHPQSYAGTHGGDWTDLQAVTDLPHEAGAAGCDLGDSVLVMFDPNTDYFVHPCTQYNLALSPWIDLTEAGAAGRAGVILEYGGYSRLVGQPLYVLHRIQWFPFDPEHPELGPSDFGGQAGFNVNSTPATCANESSRVRVDFTGVVPPYAERIRVGLGVENPCRVFFCECYSARFNSTPWFDDVRVAVFDTAHASVSVPAEPGAVISRRLGAFTPNPFDRAGPGVLTYEVPEPGHARLDIFDVAGRHIRTLLDASIEAGVHKVYWDGADASGRSVAEGLYLIRLSTGGVCASGRVVVMSR